MANVAFPSEFTLATKALLGSEYALFENVMQQEALVSIRLNDKTNKVSAGFPTDAGQVKWCPSGRYLSQRPNFTLDPLLHAGAYYVQEASSMFLYQAVKQHFADAKTVLDLCAAPGGKSTLLLQALNENSLLVANEIIRSRAQILVENITKWGNPNVIVTNNKPADFQKITGFFDAIVVDAPCSGEGMFRKDRNAIAEWSAHNVAMCAERQRGILQDVWQALKPNGILTYSTCTFNRAENEDNVHWIAENLGAEILKIDTAAFPEITETDGGYRFYPHRTKGEGFFLSVLRKSDNENNVCRLKLKNKIPKKINFSDFSEIKLKTSDFDFIEKNNIIKAYSVNKKEEILFIEENLHCLMAGLEMGEIKGKDFIPAHTVAMSKAFDFQQINTVDADYKTAIYYLKKTAIYLENAPLGYNLLCFENAPLGWVKNLGNRCNNLYPANWRIKMNFDENY